MSFKNVILALNLAKPGHKVTFFGIHTYLNDIILYYHPHFLNWIWNVCHFSTAPESTIFNRSRWSLDEAQLQTLVYTCIEFKSSMLISSYLTREHKLTYVKGNGRTDGRTDRQTDGQAQPRPYPSVSRGIIKLSSLVSSVCLTTFG